MKIIHNPSTKAKHFYVICFSNFYIFILRRIGSYTVNTLVNHFSLKYDEHTILLYQYIFYYNAIYNGYKDFIVWT